MKLKNETNEVQHLGLSFKLGVSSDGWLDLVVRSDDQETWTFLLAITDTGGLRCFSSACPPELSADITGRIKMEN